MKLFITIFLLSSALIAANRPELGPIGNEDLSTKKVCFMHRPIEDKIQGAQLCEDAASVQKLTQDNAAHQELDRQLRRCELLFMVGVFTFAFSVKLVMMLGGL